MTDINQSQQQYRLLIVEDDETVRKRLFSLLNKEPLFSEVLAEKNYQEGLAALLAMKPDILLTDIGLPDGSGIDIIRAIHDNHLDCEAMVVSGFQDEHIVFDALAAGATSYILKHDESTKIVDAIQAMMAGGSPISPVIAKLMLRKFQQQESAPAKLPEALTERQMKILKLVSQGFSSREIAEKLDISYYTVTTHIKNIYGKLQVNGRTEALYEAVRLGLI